MKKHAPICLATCLIVCVAATESRAGSIDYLTNQSADYIRTFSRNAATDAVDIVSHNPAGTAFLPKNGLYLSLSGQTVLKKFTITYREKDYIADDATPFLPSFHTAFKWNNLAIFGAFTVPAGGGSLEYPEGVPFLYPLALLVKSKDGTGLPTKGHFEGSSMYLAGTLGASYKLFGLVSVSAAMRVLSAKKKFLGWAYYETKLATLEASKAALGVGGIFGIHIRPFKYLDIGIRFETETGLEFETESETENLSMNPNTALESFIDGAKERRNLPAVMGLGVAIHPFKALTINLGMQYYFNSSADSAYHNGDEADKGGEECDPDPTKAKKPCYLGQKDVPGASGFVRGYDDDYDDGIEIAASIEYRIFKNLVVSAGYNHAFSGSNAKTLSDFEYTLDSNAFGFGARYGFLSNRLKVTAAFGAVFYGTANNETVHPMIKFLDKRPGCTDPNTCYAETFDKRSYVIALGVEYRLF